MRLLGKVRALNLRQEMEVEVTKNWNGFQAPKGEFEMNQFQCCGVPSFS